MKRILIFFICLTASMAQAQNLWERNDKLVCFQSTTDVDEIKSKLRKDHGKDCDYLRDSTRVVIGNFFKCPGDKIHPYFRTKEACEMFFMEGKKDLVKFAPADNLNPKKWVEIFGSCMEKATQKQVNKMGLLSLNRFCHCVADKTSDKITGPIVQSCSKDL